MDPNWRTTVLSDRRARALPPGRARLDDAPSARAGTPAAMPLALDAVALAVAPAAVLDLWP